MPLAVIAGTALRGAEPRSGASRREIATSRGPVAVLDRGDIVVLQRHGLEEYRPPHLIDHVANLEALALAGCDRVLATSSVGSLRRDLAVGSFVCPADFVALGPGVSAFDDQRGHLVPGFDPEWRRRVIAAWAQVGAAPLHSEGVYWQQPGPRFETAAEIRVIAPHADVIGMTVASECTVAGELGLPYAAVCTVDNLANGIGERPLSEAEFAAGLAMNRQALERALLPLVETLAAEEAGG